MEKTELRGYVTLSNRFSPQTYSVPIEEGYNMFYENAWST